jgi:hypothetical protein
LVFDRRPSKIIKVVSPAETSSKSNGDVIVIDEDSESDGDEKKYVTDLLLGNTV